MSAPIHGRGFSLIELLTVLAVAVILVSVALPDLSETIRRQRLKAAANDLYGAIELTRSQAIARGRRVLLVPADAGVDWRDGWIVFVDLDGDGRPGGGDEVIVKHGPVAGGITSSSSFSGHAPPYLAYNGAGRSCSATSSLAAHWGTLSLFQGRQTRRIKINMLGRARVCDPAREPASCTGDAEPL